MGNRVSVLWIINNPGDTARGKKKKPVTTVQFHEYAWCKRKDYFSYTKKQQRNV